MVPFHLPKKVILVTEKSKYTPAFVQLRNTVVMLHLGQCVCMKIEVTENQGEAHCSNHIFNEVGDPSYIMSCPHHKIHQRNHILDCLMYSAEHPALHRANYTAKYAP